MSVLRKQNYYLLREMVIVDFKLRYQNSVLGYIWSLARPLALFGILYVVFVNFLKVGNTVPHYPVYLLLGIVFWNFFLEATTLGMRSIVEKGDLIRKVSVPKFILVIAPAVSAFVNMLLNFGIVLIFAAVSGVKLHAVIIFIPFLLIELLLISVAFSFLLSALFVRFRDIAYIWELGAQLFFYATPIIYPLSILPPKIAKILLLSPMAQVIQDSRYSLVTTQTVTGASVLHHGMSFIPFILVGLLVTVSTVYFRLSSRYFAENI